MKQLQALNIWKARLNKLEQNDHKNNYITKQSMYLRGELISRIEKLEAVLNKTAVRSINNHFAALANLKFN